jgi:tetratricopeptide (TPR) repeat protein
MDSSSAKTRRSVEGFVQQSASSNATLRRRTHHRPRLHAIILCMGMLSRLVRQIATRTSGPQRYEAHEVRKMIDRGELSAADKAIDLLLDTTPKLSAVKSCLLAEVLFRRFKDADAEALFRDVLREEPGMADAHYGLALVLLARGETELAARYALFASTKAPGVARFKAQLGLCLLELRNFGPAESALADATRLDPEDKSSWNNYGIALRAAGNATRAKRAFEHALSLDDSFSQAKQNLQLLQMDLAKHEQHAGQDLLTEVRASSAPDKLAEARSLAAHGRLQDALVACEQLVIEAPDDFNPSLEIYRLSIDLGDVQSGIDAMEAFLARHPGHVQATSELGKAFVRAGYYKSAEPLLETALAAQPGDASLLLAMSIVCEKLRRFADAGRYIEEAYRVEPSFHMKGRLAASLVNRCRYEEALAVIDELLREVPGCADSVVLMQAEAFTQLGRHTEALPLVEQQLQKYPNHGGLRFVRATVRLLHEEYGPGWDDYAMRALGATVNLRMLAFPQWRGEPLEGKRILVMAEQGLGDQVMLSSCLPDLLARRPAKVVVEANIRVAQTLARSFPDCEVVATKQDDSLEWVRAYPDMDYFVPMGELPQQFRRTVAEFPVHSGYLKADPDRVAYWRGVLAGLGPGQKIGVSWRGGTEQTRTVVRSIEPEQLANLAHGVEAQWVCLQYGPVEDALTRASGAGMRLHYWKPAIDNLDEFAALICALDLVVTVCNTTVHYAGGLGQPVWVMAPKVPEWRYGLFSDRMPWYPSSRVYRQKVAGDWGPLLARVRQDLSASRLRPRQHAHTALPT